MFGGQTVCEILVAAHWEVVTAHWQVAKHIADFQYVNYNIRGAHTSHGALGCAHDAQSRQVNFVTTFNEISNLLVPFALSKFE